MTISGRFGNTSGAPYLEGRLFLPRLKKIANVSFLVDTGADCTTLMPLDGTRMGLDYSQFTQTAPCNGMGGTSFPFVEQATLIFLEPQKRLCVYVTEIMLPAPAPDYMTFPSLLGRDILNRWQMTSNFKAQKLIFRVLSTDISIPLPKT